MKGTTFNYYLKARDMKEATAWVNNVKKRMEYYDKLSSAGQSEVAELWNEEERRSGLNPTGEETAKTRRSSERHNSLLYMTEDITRYSTSWSIKNNAENGEVQFEGWLKKKSPSKWVKWQER